MKYLIYCLLFVGCSHMDVNELTARKKSTLPVCLTVVATPYSFQKDIVAEIAADFNEDIGFRAFKIAPACHRGDSIIPVTFVSELPEVCGERGCIQTPMQFEGRPFFRRILIHEDAPWTTIRHEIAHAAGCEHDEWRTPCNM